MLFIIIIIIILIFGIIGMCNLDDRFDGVAHTSSTITLFLAGIVLVTSLCILISFKVEYLSVPAKYKVYKVYIESLPNEVFQEERSNIIYNFLNWNSEIERHKIMSNNIWFGVFYSKEIANLVLFDPTTLPNAKQLYDVDINTEEP